MISLEAGLLALAAAVLGALLGSFIATLCLRWPKGKGVSAGRSRCDHCAATLRPSELVPVFSALLSRGRCRRCGWRIDPFHRRVELGSAAIGAAAMLAAPWPAAAALALFGWLLLPLILLDWRHYWLPDRLTLLLAAAGLGVGGMLQSATLSDRLIGGIAGFAALALIGNLYRWLRHRQGLGKGDPKLFGAIGLWVGWALLPQLLLLGACLGVLLAIVRRRGLDAATAIPFGAPLGAAAWLVAALHS